MELSPEIIAWVIAILIISSLIHGILGFAFSVVATSLLPLILGFKTTIAFMILMNVFAIGFAFFWTKSGFSWKDARAMVIGGALGVPVGLFIIVSVDEQLLLHTFGILLMLIAANHFFLNRRGSREASKRWEFPVGFISGVLAGGFNMGGPPVVAYVYSKNWSPDKIKSVMASVYLTTATIRIFFVGTISENMKDVLGLFALTVLPVAVFLYLGVVIGRKLSAQWIKTVVFVFIGIMGLAYLIR